MKKKIIDQVKDFFGNGFKKKLQEAESYKELRRELRKKVLRLEEKLKGCKSKSEKKVLTRKIEVLKAQLVKIEQKLAEQES